MLRSMSKSDIDDFITEQGTHYRKSTVAALAGLLRSAHIHIVVARSATRHVGSAQRLVRRDKPAERRE
jgi:hypothetical protein